MPGPDHTLFSLFRTNFQLESEAVGNLLVTNGVPAMSRWSGMAPFAMRAPAPDLSVAEVAIYRSDLDAALAVLQSHRDELTCPTLEPQQFSDEQRDVLRAYDVLFMSPIGLVLPLLEPFLLLFIFIRWAVTNNERIFPAFLAVLALPFFLAALFVLWCARLLDAAAKFWKQPTA